MSKVFQIIARAIRNCTHSSLEEDERTVTPILYLSPDIENRYETMIETNRSNVPYLNMLKESTIECLLNQRIHPEQVCFNPPETPTPTPTVEPNPPEWIGYNILYSVDVRFIGTGPPPPPPRPRPSPSPSPVGGGNKKTRKGIKSHRCKKTRKGIKPNKRNKTRKGIKSHRCKKTRKCKI